MYLLPGGASLLKGASLVVGMYKFIIRPVGRRYRQPVLKNATFLARYRPFFTAHFDWSVGRHVQG